MVESVMGDILYGRTPPHAWLKRDLAYQILMARIYYLRYKYPLPASDDVEGLAEYWKRLYNTRFGKGTVKKAIEKYKEYCI